MTGLVQAWFITAYIIIGNEITTAFSMAKMQKVYSATHNIVKQLESHISKLSLETVINSHNYDKSESFSLTAIDEWVTC